MLRLEKLKVFTWILGHWHTVAVSPPPSPTWCPDPHPHPHPQARDVLGEGGLDLTHPGSAAALSALVPRLVDAERTEEAQRLIDAALESHPEFAGFHAIHGEFLEASGAPDEVVREALERAVQLDMTHAHAHDAHRRLGWPVARDDEFVLAVGP